MAQNRELGDLAQIVTVDNSTNNVFIGGSITVGNSTLNATINATSVSINATSTNSFTIGTAAYHVANGNFGIGNTTPAHKLSVSGTSYFGANIAFDGTYITFGATNPVLSAPSYLQMPGGLYVSGGTLYVANRMYARGGISNDSGAYLEIGAGTSGLTYMSANVGIGNTAPTQKLHVQGTAFATSDFRAPLFYDSDNTAYYVDAAGTSNLNGLTVAGTINAASYTVGSVFTANSSGLTTTANVSIGAAGELIVTAGAGIYANGGLGSAGQVLHSNGSSVYWAADDNSGTVTSVGTGNGLTGGAITTTGTVSVLANSGITANTTGLFVTQGTGTVVNATGVHVNATYIGTLSANNSSFLGGTAAASYQLNSTLNANIAAYLPTYTGVVNGSSHTVGTAFTANATVVNAVSYYAGTTLIGNTTGPYGKTEGNLNVNSAVYANLLLRIDDRIIIANDFPSQTLRFGFTSFNNNNTSPWADFLHMRSYTDSSGGSDNLVVFNKSAIGVRVYQAAWSNLTTGNTSAYSTYKDLAFTDGTNSTGTWSINTSGTANNATFAFGLSAASTTATGSTVVTRDANGDFNGRYINASYHNSSDDVSTGTLTYLMGKFGDNYHRSATAAKVATFISGQTMNIAGNATTATGAQGATFATATTASEGQLLANFTGQSAAYLFNNGTAWGLYSASGGGIISYSRTNARCDLSAAYTQAAGSMRAPIFYDSDNTAYYCNPNSTTSLRTVGSWRADSSTWDGEYSGKIQYHGNHWYFQAADTMRFRNSAGSDVFVVNQSGNIYAPIWYDSNNTGYYVDGNSTSNIYRVIAHHGFVYGINSNWNTDFTNTPVATKNVNGDTSTGASTGGPGGTWWFQENMRHNNSSNYWGTQVAWGWEDNSNRLMQRNVSGNSWSGWVEYLNTGGRTFSGSLTMTSSITGTIFYDYNDTAYYVDPKSTSNVLNVRSSGNRFNNISFASRSGHNSLAILWNGKLFTSAGNAGSWNNATTGRGTNNTLQFWGAAKFKQVAFPAESSDPIQVGGFVHSFAFALFANGNLYTWGNNNLGQLGLGDTTARGIPTLSATGVTNVYWHGTNSCYNVDGQRLFIKKTDGYIYGCGYNGYGSLGLGDTTNRTSWTQITALGTNVTNVWNMGASFGSTVVQKSDQSIWAAGNNGNGQLGLGNTTQQNSFVNVTTAWGGGTGYNLRKVIGGFGFSDSGGNGTCWMGMLLDNGTTTVFRTAGNRSWGSIGNGVVDGANVTTPATPSVGSGRISDVAGYGGGTGTVMCLKADGTLYAWGRNAHGQCGNGGTADVGTPFVTATGVEQIFCDGHDKSGYSYFNQSFHRRTNGRLYGTGFNDNGYLGIGNATSPITSWTQVKLPYDAVVIDIAMFATTPGGAINVFLTNDGRLFFTGYNGHNGINNDTTISLWAPVQADFIHG